MLISAAICTHDRDAALAAAVASLAAKSLPHAQYEILIIDNIADADSSRARAQAYRGVANLRWHHEPREGLASARNLAIAQAQAPLLAFIDDDAVAEPGWLQALLAGFARFGDGASVLGGPVRPIWLAPRPDWLSDGLLPYLSLVDYGPAERLLAADEWVAGANIAYRVAAIRAAGGFEGALGRRWSGSILLSNEESELAQRLRAAGAVTGWVPAAGVSHCIGPDRLDRAWFRRRAAWQAVSDFLVHPDHQSRHVGESRRQAESYFAHLGHPRALAVLGRDNADPALSHWQVSAIYHLVLDLLDGARREL
jgi:glycosyltransferase involved in cell wall biosynthesis